MMIAGIAAMILALSATDTPAPSPASPTATAPGAAQTADQASGQPAAKAKADPNALICHEEAFIGSRFPRKVCQTRRGAAMRAQDDRESIRHVQDATPAPIVR